MHSASLHLAQQVTLSRRAYVTVASISGGAIWNPNPTRSSSRGWRSREPVGTVTARDPRGFALKAYTDEGHDGAGVARFNAMGGIRDYVALAKPRITALVAFTTASGLWLAPIRPSPAITVLTLLGTVLAVASANVLNMYLERETDALMSRTACRPLPARRMDPRFALGFGLLLGAVSLPLLSLAVGPLPGLLAAIALVSYVLLYTPMKRRSPASLLVGAVAGALPPLIGWTAATGTFDLPGLLLFAVLFLWQVPHFLAIALFRRDDYARAGLLVLPNEPGGDRRARRNIVFYTVALVSVSFLFVPLGVAHNLYFVTAFCAGALFLAYGLNGLSASTGRRWARNEFALSVAYLTVLLGALVIDRPQGTAGSKERTEARADVTSP